MSVWSLIQRQGKDVTIQRPTWAADNAGHQVPTYASHLSTRMFLQPQYGDEPVRHGGERHVRAWKAYGFAGLDILPKDRIVYVDAAGTTRTLTIESARNPLEMTPRRYGSHLECHCEEVEPL